MKRGQITLFVILGIIVLAVIGLGIYFKESLLEQRELAEVAERAVVAPEVQQIYNHVFDCVDRIARDGLVVVGLQGGYFEPPEDSIELPEEGIAIAIGFDKGENKLPSLETIRSEMAAYVDSYLPTCVDLELFEGYSFEEDLPTTQVDVLDDRVVFVVNYPIKVEKNGNVFNLNTPYKFPYPVRLQRVYEISQKIVQKEIENPTSIDINYLLDLGVEIDVLPFDDESVVYLLTDEESELDDLPYIFMFGNRFEK